MFGMFLKRDRHVSRSSDFRKMAFGEQTISNRGVAQQSCFQYLIEPFPALSLQGCLHVGQKGPGCLRRLVLNRLSVEGGPAENQQRQGCRRDLLDHWMSAIFPCSGQTGDPAQHLDSVQLRGQP